MLLRALAVLVVLLLAPAVNAEDAAPPAPAAQEAAKPESPAAEPTAATPPAEAPPAAVSSEAHPAHQTHHAAEPAAEAKPAPEHKTTEPAPVKVDELEKLVATLKDDAARGQLVSQLETLIAIQRHAEKKAEGGFLGKLSEAIGAVGDGVTEALGTLKDIPALIDMVIDTMTDPDARLVWGRLAAELIAVFFAGWLAERVLQFILSRPRHAAAPKPESPFVARIPFVLIRLALDLIPLGAFAAIGFATATVFELAGNAALAATMILIAYAGVRGALIAIRTVVSPDDVRVRLVPMDDETAEYLVIWTRRIFTVGLAGWIAADIAFHLGLPRPAYLALEKVLGLTVATMAVIFVLQNRTPVANTIRKAAQPLGGRLIGFANRVADIWHILISLYIAAAYVVWAIPVKGGTEFMLRATVLTAVILTIAGAASGLLKRTIDRGFALSQDVKARLPMLEARANRYLPVLQLVSRVAIGLVTLLALMQAWGINTFAWLASDMGRSALSSLISIAAVLMGALVVWELVSSSIERYLASGNAKQSARARTLLPLAKNAFMVVLIALVTLIVLSELGVNIAPLLAGAGVLGIAIGFGSQKMVQDVITGAFILFENTIAVGDEVTLDAHNGVVEAMSIRAIRLRDIRGHVHTIPFGAVGTVINMSRDYAYALFDIGVAYKENTDHVVAVLTEVGDELKADPAFAGAILDRLDISGVERFDDSAVVIRARFRTQPAKQWAVKREFNRRMKIRFDAEGIDIPFPQQTVWVAEPPAPPMLRPPVAAG